MKQFNVWERYFDKNHPKHIYQVNRHEWFINRINCDKLLDVGCCDGVLLYLAAQKNIVKSELHGIDISETTTTFARQKLLEFPQLKTYVEVCDAHKINKENDYFDCVVCGETLEHVKNDMVVIGEIYRVLKINGVLLASVPRDGHLSKEHIRLYNKKSFNKLIECVGFKIVEEQEMKASANSYYLLMKAIKI